MVFNPKPMTNATMEVADTDYAAQISSWLFKNAAKSVTFKGSKPTAKYTGAGAPAYTVDITAAQDWEDPESLCNYLLAHDGETVDVVFAPNTGGASFTATVTLVASDIGGAADEFGNFTVSLESTKPVRTPALP